MDREHEADYLVYSVSELRVILGSDTAALYNLVACEFCTQSDLIPPLERSYHVPFN